MSSRSEKAAAPHALPARPGPADLQAAIEQVRAALEAFARGGVRRGAVTPRAEEASSPPAARGRAGALMDWLRIDLSGRYFGLEAVPEVDIALGSRPAVRDGPILLPALKEAPWSLGFTPTPAPLIDRKDAYQLDELLGGRDDSFLRNAYVALLRREPDPQGFANFQWDLRGGVTREEVLRALSVSPEGRAANVSLKGLRWARFRAWVRRLPLLGHGIAVLGSLWRLPAIARDLDRTRIELLDEQWRLDELAAAVEWRLHTVESGLGAWIRALSAPIGELDGEQRRMQAELASVHDAVAVLRDAELAMRHWSARIGENMVYVDSALARMKTIGDGHATRADIARLAEPLRDALAALGAFATDLEARKAGTEEMGALATDVATRIEGLRAQGSEMADRWSRLYDDAKNEIGTVRAQGAADLERQREEARTWMETAASAVDALRAQSSEMAEVWSRLYDDAKNEIGTVRAQGAADLERQREEARTWMEAAASSVDALRAQRAADSERNALEAEQRDAEDSRRLAELREQIARASQFVPAPQGAEFDRFYAEFEDRFRGATEDILARLWVYVPLIDALPRELRESALLDIGSGRGEWLQVLKEHGLQGRGVDSNGAMVERCGKAGLEAVQADGLAYLRGLEEATLGAVTAFHVVEHLSFGSLLALFDESLRVLRPGGLVIFETPNPENLVVGACNFWCDPTHVRPLPPELLRYVVAARGFERVEVKRLHPAPSWERLPEAGADPVPARLNNFLYGEQDYAIVAYKPVPGAR